MLRALMTLATGVMGDKSHPQGEAGRAPQLGEQRLPPDLLWLLLNTHILRDKSGMKTGSSRKEIFPGVEAVWDLVSSSGNGAEDISLSV